VNLSFFLVFDRRDKTSLNTETSVPIQIEYRLFEPQSDFPVAMTSHLVALLPQIIPRSPDSGVLNPSELFRNMLGCVEKIDIGTPATASKTFRQHLRSQIPIEKEERR